MVEWDGFDAPGQRPAEVDRVIVQRGTAGRGSVRSAGWTGQRELERALVAASPFGDDVGDQATVMRSATRPVARAISMRCIHVSRVPMMSTRYPIVQRSCRPPPAGSP